MTQQEILNSMLDRVQCDYDKTEGGLFFDMLSPISFELDETLKLANNLFINTFGLTAQGEYLDLIVQEVNLKRRLSTKAKGQATFEGQKGTIIPKGFLISSDSFLFETSEEVQIGENGKVTAPIISKEEGEQNNLPIGAINKIVLTTQGISSVKNEVETKDGYNTETDEELRARYLFKIREIITSGNANHYRDWALSVDGVGACKVLPLWNGNGTVKVVIINSNKEVADSDLLERVKNHIEKERPVGANVTVTSATPKIINISVEVEILENFVKENVKEDIKKNVNKYFQDVAFKTEYLSFAKVGSVILTSEGVGDYKNLKLNQGTENIEIGEEELIKLGTFDIEEV